MTDRFRDWSLGQQVQTVTKRTISELPLPLTKAINMNISTNYWGNNPTSRCIMTTSVSPFAQIEVIIPRSQLVNANSAFMVQQSVYDAFVATQMSYIRVMLDQLDSVEESFDYLQTFDFNTMNDVVTKDFYKRQKQNAFTFSPMTHTHYWGTAQTASVPDVPPVYDITKTGAGPTMLWYTNQQNLQNNFFVGESVPGSTGAVGGFTPSELLLIVEALEAEIASDQVHVADVSLSKAKSAFTNADLDLLMTLAEAPEIVSTVYKLIRQIMSIFKAVRNGEWRKYAPKLWKRIKATRTDTRKFAREVYGMSQIWLELRYAIRPIVYDIMGLLKIAEGSDPLTDHQSYYGYEQRLNEIVDLPVLDGSGLDTGMRLTAGTDLVGKAGILGELSCDQPELKQLGLTNIGSLIWDKITYSFVLGWIVDVGQLLYDFNPTVVYREKGVWVTTSTTSVLHVVKSVGVGDSAENLTLKLNYTKTNRVIDPVSRYFTLDVKLDGLKLLDLLALTKGLWLADATKKY